MDRKVCLITGGNAGIVIELTQKYTTVSHE
ncbi:hypothetical protein CLV38_11178 [Alkalibacterium olivapovliticus]|uniref:Uncharacterized protein n=1 Tax=Alkalibacterium olivapovliticus TaxID=99907 RepID=A0A2T0W745_9LACT|nr:hypothetical protein CLV38_11178 [Alkalibacterium olivapovliticus]